VRFIYRKQVSCPGYVAPELSGFLASVGKAIDEQGDMATGPQDAEVSRCFEPLGAQGAVGDGGRRAFGMLGAAVPAVLSAPRGGRAYWAGRSYARMIHSHAAPSDASPYGHAHFV